MRRLRYQWIRVFEAAPALEAELSRFRATGGDVALVLIELRCPGFLLRGPLALGPENPQLLEQLSASVTLGELRAAAAALWPGAVVLGLRGEVQDQFALVLAAQPPPGPLAELVQRLEALLHEAAERRLGDLALAALRRSPDAMEISIGGGLAFMNEAWHKLTGYTKEEAFAQTPGRLLRDPVAPVFDADFYGRADALIAQGVPWNSVLASRPRTGVASGKT